MKVTTILKGHTSQETAYTVGDYPYGYRLRCKINAINKFKIALDMHTSKHIIVCRLDSKSKEK